MLDDRAIDQIRETRYTLLDHLGAEPDDFKALFMAGVIAEIDPDRDAALLEHAVRARALRDGLGAAWGERAREHGLDVLLYNLAEGMHRAGIGLAAVPVLARRCAEVTARGVVLGLLRERLREHDGAVAAAATAAIEAAIRERAPAVGRGVVDASFVPDALRGSRHARIKFHSDGHLAEVAVKKGRTDACLRLAAIPGTGWYRFEGRTGGHGHITDETYRAGKVTSTLSSPWHDGCEASETLPWLRWVAECLASLAEAA